MRKALHSGGWESSLDCNRVASPVCCSQQQEQQHLKLGGLKGETKRTFKFDRRLNEHKLRSGRHCCRGRLRRSTPWALTGSRIRRRRMTPRTRTNADACTRPAKRSCCVPRPTGTPWGEPPHGPTINLVEPISTHCRSFLLHSFLVLYQNVGS